jgi:hypothetical protein
MENNCFINSILSPLPYSSTVIALEEATLNLRNNYLDNRQSNLECPYVMRTNTNQSIFKCWNYAFAFNVTHCSIRTQSSEIPAVTPAPTDSKIPYISSIKLPVVPLPLYSPILSPVILDNAPQESPSVQLPLFTTETSSLPEKSSQVSSTSVVSSTPSTEYLGTKSNNHDQRLVWMKVWALTSTLIAVCNV